MEKMGVFIKMKPLFTFGFLTCGLYSDYSGGKINDG
jgi:hypothetical protein